MSIRSWKLLELFNLYRFVLAAAFFGMVATGKGPSLLGAHAPGLFLVTSACYGLVALLGAAAVWLRWPAFAIQVYIHVGLDVPFLTVLMHASGGIGTGLGLLLLISVAAGSLLLEGRTSLLVAALATLGVLFEQVYAQLHDSFATTYYTQAGMLGAAYFAAAILAHALAKRAAESEALAQQRGADLANMAQLTDYVIERMQTGVVVVDSDHRVWLINKAARQLLGVDNPTPQMPLASLSRPLARRMRRWREDSSRELDAFQSTRDGPQITPRFARLGEGEQGGTLLFLEDTSAVSQRAQQMKLASLGRLTASIAHEVRNPLAAISQAAQLLGESGELGAADARLCQIIHGQCRRMNDIVHSVLQLSRREPPHTEELPLLPWLQLFGGEIKQSNRDVSIEIDVEPADLTIRADPQHLRQILYNLCQNGIRYSRPRSGKPLLSIRGSLRETTPVLDVIDRGPGIAPEVVDQIFEPFFTTEPNGTGLGLYIARELCESGQARLSYLPDPDGGSCFRITFADRRRRIA